MAIVNWINGKQTSFLDPTAWDDRIVPPLDSTDVISAAGDGAPTAQTAVAGFARSYILSANAISSTVDLYNGPLETETSSTVFNSMTGTVFTSFDTPPPAAVTPGQTVTRQTLDLLGAGSVASLILQDSTLDASTNVNVSGVGYAYAGYTNTLAGTINIGLPLSVGGTPVATPPADANGQLNELGIDVQGWGSWSGANLSDYIPTTTNSGVINVGSVSLLNINLAGHDAATSLVTSIFSPPSRSQFVNSGLIDVGPSGTLLVQSPGDRGLFRNDGTIRLHGADGTATTLIVGGGTLSGTGSILVDGGTASRASTKATFTDAIQGQTVVISNATVELDGNLQSLNSTTGVARYDTFSGGSFVFADDKGSLKFADYETNTTASPFATGFTDTITGFRAGDTLSFSSLIPVLGLATNFSFVDTWNQATNQLAVYRNYTVNGQAYGDLFASVTILGTYAASAFTLPATIWDGNRQDPASVAFTAPPGTTPCFAFGTRIETASGEVAVETLRVGDAVVTVQDGKRVLRPIRWIGRRRVDLARHPEPALAQPIRIRRGAIAANVPHHDLLVSPDHAMFLGGVLIPAKLLVNGRSIVQDTSPREVTYYHVELDCHCVILAEGAQAESYLDTGNRASFAACSPVVALHPAFETRREVGRGCAPLAIRPDAIRSILEAIDERAGRSGTAAPKPFAVAS